jgi:hypothetical protein
MHFDARFLPDITVAVRLDQTNALTPGYHLPPYLDVGRPRIRLANQNLIAFESHRLDSHDGHYGVARRQPDLMVEFESITTTISQDQP